MSIVDDFKAAPFKTAFRVVLYLVAIGVIVTFAKCAIGV